MSIAPCWSPPRHTPPWLPRHLFLSCCWHKEIWMCFLILGTNWIRRQTANINSIWHVGHMLSPILLLQGNIFLFAFFEFFGTKKTTSQRRHLKRKNMTSWWCQPIWKILYSQIASVPQVRLNIKNIWNHHRDDNITTHHIIPAAAPLAAPSSAHLSSLQGI